MGAPLPQGETPFEQLVDLMATLRGPQGCPWDREQTHQKLTPYLIEEAYETLECIESGEMSRLREELGDLLLQIVFHAQLAAERGEFTVQDVAAAIVEKMVRRHPHVFGETRADSPDEVLRQWEQLKLKEKAEKVALSDQEDAPSKSLVSLMDGIPRHLPALLAAERMTGRAAEVGFRWPEPADSVAKVREECDEVLEAWERGDHAQAREEMGDLLFAVANACREMGIISEDALRHANAKFARRFAHIEAEAARRGVPVSSLETAEQLLLWEDSKVSARTPRPPETG
ncbi:MAG: nucleoside triphosphate pyrophosphohydrolase [Armatimonadetes bacterium]|nr:nucleoside triphosphate pyrophosphohydrolase [Armatimonadota bacterium]